jgi:beta-lactamase class A
MHELWTRRGVVAAASVLPWAVRAGDNPIGLIEAVQARVGGRLGVAVLDTGSGRRIGHRSGERFAMCSTFKLLLAGQVLHKVDIGTEKLDRWIAYTRKDILPHSPVAEAHLGEGRLTVERMIQAAIEDSDNTCANALLGRNGGPAGCTNYIRLLGDRLTRLDRTEPALNTAIPGDPSDTTTPDAMLDDLKRLTLGDALRRVSRGKLVAWLANCRTAASRIPAGLPKDWKSGNKTGTGENGATNDVAILWPPNRAPVLMSVYFTESKIDFSAREAAIADIARIVAGTFA